MYNMYIMCIDIFMYMYVCVFEFIDITKLI